MRQSVCFHGVRSLLVALGSLLGVSGLCQGFNIDLDEFSGPPNIGSGAPSSSFGAAAGQPGFWNRMSFGIGPYELRDLTSGPTNVTVTVDSSAGSFHGGGQAFEGNTGDYALLLNDGAIVGTLIQGATLTYTFEGLDQGVYQLFTYAVSPLGVAIDTPVYVPEAFENPLQVVTGPMPGNAFEHLVTHGRHLVWLPADGILQVVVEQPPGLSANMWINGFQIVAVPEIGTGVSFAAACLALLVARRWAH